MMKKSLEEVLRQSLQRLETSGGDIDAALAEHPQHAEELRPHLRVWASLSSRPKAEASQSGFAKGFSQLSSAVSREQEQGGKKLMNDLSRSGSFALKLLGSTAVVAGLALGIALFSGNAHVQLGSEAQAVPSHPCLDQVLGGLDGQPGFTLQDLIAFKIAYKTQNLDPRYDRNGDGRVGLKDVLIYLHELKLCFQTNPPPP